MMFYWVRWLNRIILVLLSIPFYLICLPYLVYFWYQRKNLSKSQKGFIVFLVVAILLQKVFILFEYLSPAIHQNLLFQITFIRIELILNYAGLLMILYGLVWLVERGYRYWIRSKKLIDKV